MLTHFLRLNDRKTKEDRAREKAEKKAAKRRAKAKPEA